MESVIVVCRESLTGCNVVGIDEGMGRCERVVVGGKGDGGWEFGIDLGWGGRV